MLSKKTQFVFACTHIKKQIQFTCTNIMWQISLQYWVYLVLCICFSCYTEVVFHHEYSCVKAVILEGISYSLWWFPNDQSTRSSDKALIKQSWNTSLFYKDALSLWKGWDEHWIQGQITQTWETLGSFVSFYNSPCSETPHFQGSTCNVSSKRHGEGPQMQNRNCNSNNHIQENSQLVKSLSIK